jgi:hypothetical protein
VPFKDAFNAGRQMIQDALESEGFLSGIAGWQIRRDGNAEFNNLTARGDLLVGSPAYSMDLVARCVMASGISERTFIPAPAPFLTTTSYQPLTTAPYTDILTAAQLAGLTLTDNRFAVKIQYNYSFQVRPNVSTGADGEFVANATDALGTTNLITTIARQASTNNTMTVPGTFADVDPNLNLATLYNLVILGSGAVNAGSFMCRHAGTVAYEVRRMTINTQWQIIPYPA